MGSPDPQMISTTYVVTASASERLEAGRLSGMSLTVMAAESHEEVNAALNWAVGGGVLLVLLALLGALVVFGGGREHS